MGTSDCGALAIMVLVGGLAVVWSEANSSGAQKDPNAVSNGPPKSSASGSSKEPSKTDVEACLRTEDRVLRRRAIWEMASQKIDPSRVVDAVMSDKQQYGCSRIITILGRRALPRLYHYLADLDEDTRYSALSLIAMAGQPDANAKAALQELSKEHPDDRNCQTLAELAKGVSPEDAEAQKKILASVADSPVDGMEWLLATQQKTRGWAVNRARMHLTEAIANLRHGTAEPAKSELEIQKGMLSLAFAARGQPLGPEERDCLKELESEISKPDSNYGVLMPAVVMTRWMAGGRRELALLNQALSLFGRGKGGCEERILGGLIVTFGDVMLSPDDVPVLLSRATDERAEQQVRIGALRLLGWLGSTDDRVHKSFRHLLTFERQPIRLATAEGIALLIEGDKKGALLEAARVRLSVETSQPVIDALTSSIQRLTACP